MGCEDEIQGLRRQIRELSWDSSFGMWTRNAFLQFCHVMPRDVRWIAFIDMNKIQQLNEEVGYIEVDKITIEITPTNWPKKSPTRRLRLRAEAGDRLFMRMTLCT